MPQYHSGQQAEKARRGSCPSEPKQSRKDGVREHAVFRNPGPKRRRPPTAALRQITTHEHRAHPPCLAPPPLHLLLSAEIRPHVADLRSYRIDRAPPAVSSDHDRPAAGHGHVIRMCLTQGKKARRPSMCESRAPARSGGRFGSRPLLCPETPEEAGRGRLLAAAQQRAPPSVRPSPGRRMPARACHRALPRSHGTRGGVYGAHRRRCGSRSRSLPFPRRAPHARTETAMGGDQGCRWNRAFRGAYVPACRANAYGRGRGGVRGRGRDLKNGREEVSRRVGLGNGRGH